MFYLLFQLEWDDYALCHESIHLPYYYNISFNLGHLPFLSVFELFVFSTTKKSFTIFPLTIHV